MIKQKIYDVFISALVVIIVGVSPVMAQELSVYNKGLMLYSAGNYKGAAEEWHSIAQRLERLGGDRDSYLKRGAFSYVLSTISYEKSNNSLAYDDWASSMALYSRIDTSWEDQKEVLEKNIASLASDRDDPLKDYLKSNDRVLLNLNNTLDLVYYNGPRAGLNNMKSNGYNSMLGNDGYNQ